MLVGDTVLRTPTQKSGYRVIGGRRVPDAQPQKVKVTYIHPARRYYTVRFVFDGGSYCESYYFKDCGGG